MSFDNLREVLIYGNLVRASENGIKLAQFLPVYNNGGEWGSKGLNWLDVEKAPSILFDQFAALCSLLKTKDFIRDCTRMSQHFLQWCPNPHMVRAYIEAGHQLTRELLSRLSPEVLTQAFRVVVVVKPHLTHQFEGQKIAVEDDVASDYLVYPQLDLDFERFRYLLDQILTRAQLLQCNAPFYWQLIKEEYRQFFKKYVQKFYTARWSEGETPDQKLTAGIVALYGEEICSNLWETMFSNSFQQASETVQAYLMGFDPWHHIPVRNKKNLQKDEIQVRLKLLLKLGPEKFVEYLQKEVWPKVDLKDQIWKDYPQTKNEESVHFERIEDYHPADRLYLGYPDGRNWCFVRTEWAHLLEHKKLQWCQTHLTAGNLALIQSRLLLSQDLPPAASLVDILKSFQVTPINDNSQQEPGLPINHTSSPRRQRTTPLGLPGLPITRSYRHRSYRPPLGLPGLPIPQSYHQGNWDRRD